jgi:hypothetical protein
MLVDVCLHEGQAFEKLVIRTSFCVVFFISPDGKTVNALLVLYTLCLSGFFLDCLSKGCLLFGLCSVAFFLRGLFLLLLLLSFPLFPVLF